MAGMRMQSLLRIVFAGGLIVLVSACATTPQSGPAALAGTWTNSLATVWTINSDGTFRVVATKPKREIWGTYTLASDTITIQETRRSGRTPKNCKGPGVYKFSQPNEHTLKFTLVNDACGQRKKNALLAWHKK
jgi:hypothetical protein